MSNNYNYSCNIFGNYYEINCNGDPSEISEFDFYSKFSNKVLDIIFC